MTSFVNKSATDNICPYLGMAHDPKTTQNFPSTQNYCHFVSPSSIPEESHQRKFCLESTYRSCELYSSQSQKAKSSIFSISVNKSQLKLRKKRWLLFGLLLLIVILAVIWLSLDKGLMSIPVGASVTPNEKSDAIIPDTGSQDSVELTPTENLVVEIQETSIETHLPVNTIGTTPTLTIPPTSTFEPTSTLHPPHLLKTPFGPNGEYELHRVLGGETLEWIAENHHTSVKAIRAVNFDLPSFLWEESILVIPINQMDERGLIPMTAYLIPVDGISIQSLSQERAINLQTLCELNNRPATYIFHTGEWVLIPHVPENP